MREKNYECEIYKTIIIFDGNVHGRIKVEPEARSRS